MSVLIKGVEMPGNNNTVLFCVVDGKMKATSFDRIHDGFHEVIELPEHGRLIDADALAYSESVKKKGCAYQEEIFAAHTIVPAEGGGE